MLRLREPEHHHDLWLDRVRGFSSPFGGPVDRATTRSRHRHRETHNLPRVSNHALRHIYGLLHLAGVPARTIMESLDLLQITLMLGTYCHAPDASIGEAAGTLARALGGSALPACKVWFQELTADETRSASPGR